MSNLTGKRILVTGGAGFLGRHVCQALGGSSPAKIVVPRSAQFDLREPAVIRELLAKERPHVVVHLAAVVGGIGANRENPGRYFFDNASMASWSSPRPGGALSSGPTTENRKWDHAMCGEGFASLAISAPYGPPPPTQGASSADFF